VSSSRPEHDDRQPRGSQWCQSGLDAKESGKDQTEPAEHLTHADEPNEQARQMDLVRRAHSSQNIDWQDQFCPTRKQKEECQQRLRIHSKIFMIDLLSKPFLASSVSSAQNSFHLLPEDGGVDSRTTLQIFFESLLLCSFSLMRALTSLFTSDAGSG